MAQLKTGTVDVTNGSATVTGNGTPWLSEVEPGDAFTVFGDNVLYDISSVVSDTELTLTAPYGGATQTGVSYAISRDFTDLGLVEMSQGDVNTAAIYTRTIRKLQGYLQELGTASTEDVMTSLTDTTAGRLMPVGAFGLGTAANFVGDSPGGLSLDDWRVPNGSYLYNTSATTGFTPPPSAAGGGTVHVKPRFYNSSDGQTYQEFNEASSVTPNTYVRRYSAGSWTDWFLNFNQGNILGTVSQSGGVPTGAVIERGSNANGEYVKWADGSFMAWAEKSVDVTNPGIQVFASPVSVGDSANPIKPVVSMSHSAVQPNTALEFSNIRGITYFGNPSRWAVQLKTTGTSFDPQSVDEKLSFKMIGRWF